MKTKQADATLPLFFVSGFAADDSIFHKQKLAFPQLTVLRWTRPFPDENFQAYCERFAKQIPADRPCVVGGASFGGLVAMSVARHVGAQACVLFGSIQDRKSMPWWIRFFAPMSGLLRWIPFSVFQQPAVLASWIAGRLKLYTMAQLLRQFAQADPEIVRWSLRQVLLWDRQPSNIPIWHIHGDRDQVFPISRVSPDKIIRGGGHVISLTHGAEVNQFLEQKLKQLKIESICSDSACSS